MKLSPGTIGTILFTVAGIAVFVLMAKRPAMNGSAMNFGMPIPEATTEAKTPETTQPKEPLTAAADTAITPSTDEGSMPATPETEATKIDETTIPATPDATATTPAPEELEANIEETRQNNTSSPDILPTENIIDETVPAN